MPPASRSACDRCRIQKLRCPPSSDGTSACMRCTRLRARCITSYPRPPNGALHPLQHSNSRPELRPKRASSPSAAAAAAAAVAAGTTATTTTSMTATTASQPMLTPPTSLPANAATRAPAPFDALSFGMPDNHFDFFSSQTTTLPPDNMFLDRGFHDTATESLFRDDHSFPLGPSVSGTESSRSSTTSSSRISTDCSSTSGAVKGAQYQQWSRDNPLDERPYNILDYNSRLSSLNLDLSRRLEQCQSVTAPEDKPMMDETGLENQGTFDGGTAGQEGVSIASLFEHGLGDLSEFLVIIRSYTSMRPGSISGVGDVSGHHFVSGTSRPISIVIILSLISAYVQIVVMYDKIFQALSARIFEVSGGPAGGQQTAPVLRLNGLSVGQGNLQTKILIHAILHQFDLIERLLGLPAELRVTDKPGVYSGLFEDDRSRALLGAVCNGSSTENGWSPIDGTDQRFPKALSSLRETIKRAQASLDI